MTDHKLVDIESRVQAALAASPVYALRELQVERCGSSLCLHGAVSSFYHKQLAQEVARSLACNFEVMNSITVCSTPDRRFSMSY